MSYQLIDCGKREKLEQIGPHLVIRPASSAIWQPQLTKKRWQKVDTRFCREKGWIISLPSSWVIEYAGMKFKISPTEFGHIGLFPEQGDNWKWIQKQKAKNILNLFAYSGGATLFAAQSGAKVTHLDASKGMIIWAKENMALNGLKKAPIRWIVDDVMKFLKREVKRGGHYDGIILDPPSFGRGKQGQVFKIEDHIGELLNLCRALLSPSNPRFILLTSHTPTFTSSSMRQLLSQIIPTNEGTLQGGEMTLFSQEGAYLPSGFFARWSRDD